MRAASGLRPRENLELDIRKSPSHLPGFPVARSRAANALASAAQLRQQGRFGETIEAMRIATTLEPDNAVLFHDLGLDCLKVGLFAEAKAAFRQAIHLKPNYAHAFWRLGVTLEQVGDADAAAEALRQAIDIQPRLPDAQFHLARLLEHRGQRREAGIRYRQVLRGGPDARLRRLAEACALLTEGKDEVAEKKLRRAVEIEPNDNGALAVLGRLLTDSGAYEDAAYYMERALAQPSCAPDFYYDLVRCRKVRTDDADLLERLHFAAAQPWANADTLVRVHLALGKALDDLGRYEEAMRAFDAAADVRARAWPGHVEAFERRANRIIQRFSAEFINSEGSAGSPDPTPVLIFGMPRSGTTLIEQIVSSHPMVHGAGELQFWNRKGALMAAAGMNADAAFCIQAATDCVGHLRELAGGAARVVDKDPFNFQWAGLIHIALPRAALIHCRRSPIDTVLSIHQTYFSERSFPTGGEALVRYYRTYERLMDHWRRVLPSDRFFEVDYEELTADPIPVSKRMVAHIGLEWDDCCLTPEMNARRVKTPSRWQVRQPIYRTAVERWRMYERYLGPLAALAPH